MTTVRMDNIEEYRKLIVEIAKSRLRARERKTLKMTYNDEIHGTGNGYAIAYEITKDSVFSKSSEASLEVFIDVYMAMLEKICVCNSASAANRR